MKAKTRERRVEERTIARELSIGRRRWNFDPSFRLLGLLHSSMVPARERAIDLRTSSARGEQKKSGRKREREPLLASAIVVRRRRLRASRRLMPAPFTAAQSDGSLFLCLRCRDLSVKDDAAEARAKRRATGERESARAAARLAKRDGRRRR